MEIWKYKLGCPGSTTIKMDKNGEILCVQMQGSSLCLWAKVDPTARPVNREVLVIGTGQSFSLTLVGRYIGTVQTEGGLFIWHVFERR